MGKDRRNMKLEEKLSAVTLLAEVNFQVSSQTALKPL